jgi:hypothetical protein
MHPTQASHDPPISGLGARGWTVEEAATELADPCNVHAMNCDLSPIAGAVRGRGDAVHRQAGEPTARRVNNHAGAPGGHDGPSVLRQRSVDSIG